MDAHVRPDLPEACRIRRFDVLDGTNSEALRRLAARDARPGDAFVAALQTAGRGRGGRRWISLAGNLHATVIVPPPPARAASQLALVAGVALHAALADAAPKLGFTLKWPNDVLCNARKIAGVLIEAGDGGHAVGIGINLVAVPPDAEAAWPATSLRAEGGEAPTPDDMLERLYPALAAAHRRWSAEGFAPIREAWLASAHVPESGFRAVTPEGVFSGRFDGLGADGSLRLVDAAGVRRSVSAGDVAAAG